MEGVEDLQAGLGHGARLLLPKDDAFKQATQVWAVSAYHAPDVLPSPALVVQPRGESACAAFSCGKLRRRHCHPRRSNAAGPALSSSQFPCLHPPSVGSAGTSDVVAAVKWARARGMPLAVRGGGHGSGNPSWADGGLLIDMSLMRRFARAVLILF